MYMCIFALEYVLWIYYSVNYSKGKICHLCCVQKITQNEISEKQLLAIFKAVMYACMLGNSHYMSEMA